MGYQVVAQLGVAGFFLDLAVRHPRKPDSFILGVECDGATYHSARSARDRDRLRQEILERLGWRVHRIWSTDWYRDRGSCVGRLRTRLEQIVREDDERSRREVDRRQAQADQGVVSRSPSYIPQAGSVTPLITREEARRLLVDMREKTIARDFPDSDRTKGLLRKGLLELLLDELPKDIDEWTACIPEDERQTIDRRHLRYLDKVFDILRRVAR